MTRRPITTPPTETPPLDWQYSPDSGFDLDYPDDVYSCRHDFDDVMKFDAMVARYNAYSPTETNKWYWEAGGYMTGGARESFSATGYAATPEEAKSAVAGYLAPIFMAEVAKINWTEIDKISEMSCRHDAGIFGQYLLP